MMFKIKITRFINSQKPNKGCYFHFAGLTVSEKYQYRFPRLSLFCGGDFLYTLCYPVSTRRRFDVYTTSIMLKRRLMDVKTTSCVYWV